jgi:hypothetical protein
MELGDKEFLKVILYVFDFCPNSFDNYKCLFVLRMKTNI